VSEFARGTDLPSLLQLIPPEEVMRLVRSLTDEETDELMAYTEEVADDPLLFCAKATRWFKERAERRRVS
jgi:hypothetical protein